MEPTPPEPTIADIEAELARQGVSLAQFCRQIDIAFSTWHRWKVGGRTPRRSSWRRIVEAYRAMCLQAAA